MNFSYLIKRLKRKRITTILDISFESTISYYFFNASITVRRNENDKNIQESPLIVTYYFILNGIVFKPEKKYLYIKTENLWDIWLAVITHCRDKWTKLPKSQKEKIPKPALEFFLNQLENFIVNEVIEK